MAAVVTEYLKKEGHSVSETAEAVGYGESKNFSSSFKKFYGICPSEAKKYLRMIL